MEPLTLAWTSLASEGDSVHEASHLNAKNHHHERHMTQVYDQDEAANEDKGRHSPNAE